MPPKARLAPGPVASITSDQLLAERTTILKLGEVVAKVVPEVLNTASPGEIPVASARCDVAIGLEWEKRGNG